MISFIWDIDGTLYDSYDSIVDKKIETLNHFNIGNYDKEFIRDTILNKSTSQFFEYISECYGVEYDKLWEIENSLKVEVDTIKLMPNVKKVLEELNQKGVQNFIYTHRGPTVYDLLKKQDIDKYFVEVVNIDNGFKRKPDPEAIDYLVNKYSLNKEDTYYIGDRLIDQKCAKNANIKAIFYQSYAGVNLNPNDYDYKVTDLMQLLDLNII